MPGWSARGDREDTRICLQVRAGASGSTAIVFGQWSPLVGQEFPEPADRVAHDSPEEVVEVFPGVDVTVLAGFDETHEQSRRPAAPFAAHEEPVLSSQCDGPHGIFRQVVVGTEPAVFEIAMQCLFLIEGLIDGLPERFRRDRLGPQLFDFREYPVKDWRRMFLAVALPLFGCHAGAGGLHLMIKAGNAG